LKLPRTESGTTQASRPAFETSTPQMIFITVTCLVRCDCDQPTVRSYLTTATIPDPPAVVAKGVSGDVAALLGRGPPAKALSRFHRTFCSMGRYKGMILHENPSSCGGSNSL
jgi:hypothetical protein